MYDASLAGVRSFVGLRQPRKKQHPLVFHLPGQGTSTRTDVEERTMKCPFLCGCLIALTSLVGCIPSLNPVYTEKDLVFDRQALGVWGQPGKSAKWEFTQRDATSYRLVYTDEEGKQGIFRAHLAKLDGTLFLNLFPEPVASDASAFYQFHLMPINTVYLVKKTEPTLELMAIDFQWLDKYLAEHPQEITMATVNGGKLITAPTADLQKFVLAHQDKFTNRFELQRLEPAK
jgi:hypothetical protein